MRLLVPALCSLAAPTLVLGFAFTTNAPTSCGNLEVEWTGGTAPFTLSVFGAFEAALQIPVPAEAFSGGKGSFSTQLPLAGGTKFVVVMTDFGGFATGGISPTLTTGEAVGGASCNTTLSPQWTWDTRSQAAQCRLFQLFGIRPIAAQLQAISYPISIVAFVPGGTYRNYSVTSGYEYTIPAIQVQAGTNLILALFDSQGRSGGNSDLYTVTQSGVNGCLQDTNYISSTMISVAASATSSLSSPTSTSTFTPGDHGATKISVGTIAAIAAASCVALGALAAIGFFCWKRNLGRRRRNRVDMLGDYDSPTLLAPTTSRRYEPEPFTLAASEMQPLDRKHPVASSSSTNLTASGSGGEMGTVSAGPPSPFASTAPSPGTDASGTTSAAQRRIIMHVDAADELEEEPEVVELPPQYTERRRLPEYGSEGSAGGSAPPGDVKR